MSAGDLGGRILKDVSRSFYLSLRILPRGFREPASVGYLLARISDTIADTEALASAERVRRLAEFRELLLGGGRPDAFQRELQETFAGRQAHHGEARLLTRAGECLQWLGRLDPWQQEAVRTVADHITEGQEWDLQRFAGDGVVRLDDARELDRYTYLVAGSVGEFWTTLGFGVDPDFAALGRLEMQALGRHYGKALQLVNILRDLEDDAAKGRCYLPGSGPPEESTAVWVRRARTGLREGLRYTGAVRGKRLRAASGLPALIGLRTLDRLEASVARGEGTRVKVSRREVRRLARRAAWAAILNGPDPWDRLSEITKRRREDHD